MSSLPFLFLLSQRITSRYILFHFFVHMLFCAFSLHVLLSRKNVIYDTILSLCFLYMVVFFDGVGGIIVFSFFHIYSLISALALSPLQTGLTLLIFYLVLFELLKKIMILIIGQEIILDKFHMYSKMEVILFKIMLLF